MPFALRLSRRLPVQCFGKFLHRCWFVVIISSLFSVTTLNAQQLSDTDWIAYFGSEDTEPREFRISQTSLLGPEQFSLRVRPKGTVVIGGKEYRRTVAVNDGGPSANTSTEIFSRISDNGLYERDKDGSDALLIPRPLTVGQIWTRDKETLTFEGFTDFETFDTTIRACIKITSLEDVDLFGSTKKETLTRYYQRGKGLIYKSGTGVFPFTKILSEYASKKGK